VQLRRVPLFALVLLALPARAASVNGRISFFAEGAFLYRLDNQDTPHGGVDLALLCQIRAR
jgi:hypothetical protein